MTSYPKKSKDSVISSFHPSKEAGSSFNPFEIIAAIDFEQIRDHPNILIAARFWEDDRYHAAKVCYRFMRMIDDLIDDRKSNGKPLTEMEKECFTRNVEEWLERLRFSFSDDPFVQELVHVIERFKIPSELFDNFSNAMIFDVHETGFSSFQEFLDYAEGASVTPASVFVHLCLLHKQDGDYLPSEHNVIKIARPCAVFSYLVHIIRDFQKDQLNHLNYFALDILEKYGLTPPDLYQVATTGVVPEAFRAVIAEYYGYAEQYRLQTEEVLRTLEHQTNSRYFLSLRIIYELYLQVYERIDVASGSFTTEELNPTPGENRERTLRTIRHR